MHVAYFYVLYVLLFFFKQKTAYEMRISDWSSDVCSSDLRTRRRRRGGGFRHCRHHRIAWRCRRALRQGFRRRPSGRAERQQPTFPGDRRMSWINRVRNALPFMAKKETTAETLRSEEHTSELQSLMRISYAAICLQTTSPTNQQP